MVNRLVSVGDDSYLPPSVLVGDDNLPAWAKSGALAGKVAKGELIINAKDYGAKGDGTTDDTAAIQAAIDYAAPRKLTVFFPPGTYKLTKTTATDTAVRIVGAAPTLGTFQTKALAGCLIVRAGASLLGSGSAATILKTSSGGLSAVVECLDYQDGSIGKLTIEGAGSSNNTAHGLAFSASAPRINANIRLHDLEIRNVGSYGIGHQYGQPKNFRLENIYIHDTGADGIDWKVRYGPLDFTDTGTQGVTFDGILVERMGQRLFDVSGIDVRGQANLNNITVRDFGRAGGQMFGIDFAPGISNGVDQRSAATKSTLTNFYVEGTPANDCVGVSVLSTGSAVVSGGVIRWCASPTGTGVWVRPLTATPYGYLQGPLISDVIVEGSRGVPGMMIERPNVTIVGCQVVSDIQTFGPRRGNIAADQTSFTLWNPTVDGYTLVNKNGVTLTSGTDYTLSGTTLTLTAGALATDSIDVIVKGASAVFVKEASTTLVGVTTDGFTPGVKIIGPTTKATTTMSGCSGATNDPTLLVGNVGGSLEFTATNVGAADVDLRFTPGNNGLVRFGLWNANSDQAVNGYITIKDAAGNFRKLPTIA